MPESSGDGEPSWERSWTRRRLLGALTGGGLGAGGIWYANRQFLDTLPDNVIVPPGGESSDLGPDPLFGSSIAVSDDGTTTIIGDLEREEAYVFGQDSGEWAQRAKFTPRDLRVEDIRISGFGRSAAISADGTTALVGAAPGFVSEGGGAALAFTEEAEEWSLQANLKTLLPRETYPHFGESVALSADGSLAIIGAPISGAGLVFVCFRAEGEWRVQTKLTAEDGEGRDGEVVADTFGGAVALSRDGTTAIIGAHHDDNHNGEHAGAAYVFTRTNGGWTQQAKLTAASGTENHYFGVRVAVSGDGTTALVGDAPDSGYPTCLVFERTEDGWVRQGNFEMAGPREYADFAVSDTGTTVVIPGPSATYVYDQIEGVWELRSKLPPPNGVTNVTTSYGSVAVSGDGTTALINATQDDEGTAVYSVELGDSDGTPQ